MWTELIIGYGSLMSIKGIHGRSSTKGIPIYDAFIVRLPGKRGFNKKGPLQAFMDIDWRDFDPSNGHVVDKEEKPSGDGYIECLAIEIPLSQSDSNDFRAIGKREGLGAVGTNLYNNREKIIGELGKTCLAEYLWGIYEESIGETPRDKIVNYREKLEIDKIIGAPKSYHYVPHPVKLDNGRYGIITIHPHWGIKGNRENFVPTICELVSTYNKDTVHLKEYFQWCILGGAHGIHVKDLIKCLENSSNTSLKRELLIGMDIDKEVHRFKRKIKIDKIDYTKKFGNRRERLERSGLKAILESGSEAPERSPQRTRIKIESTQGGVEAMCFSIQDSKLEGYRSRNPRLSRRVDNKEFILLNANVRNELGIRTRSRIKHSLRNDPDYPITNLEVHQCPQELDYLEDNGEYVAVVSSEFTRQTQTHGLLKVI